jgi:hypothetical protein
VAVFIPNEAGIKKMTRSPDGEVGRHLAKLGAKLTLLAKAQAGVDTGALKQSIHYRLVQTSGGLAAQVGSDNRVALMHHQGTRPHIIVPRRAQTLRFYSHGRIVYSKLVHHPGTKPNRYLTDNLRRVI